MSAEPLSLAEYMTVARFDKAPAAPESFDATAAVRRVLALAERCEAEAERHDDAEPVSSDGLTRMILAARRCREHAADIRRAVEGQT